MDVYDIWRMFFSWITKMFFAEIHLIGKEHIPVEGPIVFVGAFKPIFQLCILFCVRLPLRNQCTRVVSIIYVPSKS